MAVIGISVSEQSSAAVATATNRIERATFIITPSGAVASLLNQSIGVTSVADFQAKYPSASEVVLQSVKFFLLNNPVGQLLVYACSDTTATGNDDAAKKQHLLTGIAALSLRTDLELSLVLTPERGGFAAQADRTAIYSAVQSMAEKFDWIYFANCADVTDTKAKAITERDLYSSPLGHSALYYGSIIDNEDKKVSVAAAAAAICLKRDRAEPYAPPSGVNYPLQGVKDIANYVSNSSDFKDLEAKQINVLQKIPRYGICLWGAQTLAVDSKFSLINTRLAVSVATFRLENALLPTLFAPSDPQGRTSNQVDMSINTVLNDLWLEGGLSGDTVNDAFKVEDVFIPATVSVAGTTGATPPTTNPPQSSVTTPTVSQQIPRNLRKVQKKIYARFVEHVQQMVLSVFVVDVLP